MYGTKRATRYGYSLWEFAVFTTGGSHTPTPTPTGGEHGPYRIPSRGNDPAFRAGGAYANYLNSYASSAGVSASTTDVFGCAGSLASNPGECAALNRHVAQLPQSQWSDPSQYYSGDS